MDKKKILIIEDDQAIRELVALHLSDLGATVTEAGDGEQGLSLAKQQGWDLIMLDIQLPGLNGLHVCRTIRQFDQLVPIMMLTSRNSETDRVLGFDQGADDYLPKPFGILELIARTKALLRRSELKPPASAIEATTRIQMSDLEIQEHTRQATINGRELDLTAREFNLLLHFVQNPGRVFSRSELLDKVWGYHHAGYEHTVNSHINRLRAKLESDPRNPSYILTCWGVGYKFHNPGTSVACEKIA